jgi:N-acetylneuraminic acid mutarotase
MRKFRIWLLFIAFPVCIFSFLSCSDDDDNDLIGNWIKRSDFGGPVRGDASCFVVGEKAYVVGGYNGNKRLNDIWEYNPNLGFWTQKADFPGTARGYAFAFASEDKGYIGTGYDGLNYYKDFWEFDPIDNIWAQKSDFPGGARYGVTAFFLDGVGYAGTGLVLIIIWISIDIIHKQIHGKQGSVCKAQKEHLLLTL